MHRERMEDTATMNPLLTEALDRLPKGTDPATILRVTRTTDDAHPGCDLRVQLVNGSFVWLKNPRKANEPVDVQVTGDDPPRLGPAAFNTRLRQAVASGEITDVVPGEVGAKQAHELARQLGVTLTGIPGDEPVADVPTVEVEDAGETAAGPGDDTGEESDGDTFTVDPPPPSDGLDDMTVLELRGVAKEEGVTGYGALTKEDLVAAIRQARGTP